MIREVTIGRDRGCDIFLDSHCVYASRVHAVLYLDGNQVMLRDCSSNGTMVNNVMVKNRAVPINYRDSIMVAGHYPISWSQISKFFPQGPTMRSQLERVEPSVRMQEQESVLAYEKEPNFGFSWGAFILYPIWGFFNGCWWAFIVWLFLGWLFIPSIVFGVCGKKWAWENRHWSSVADFEQTQHSWNIAGIVIFCVDVILIFVYASLIISFLAALA